MEWCHRGLCGVGIFTLKSTVPLLPASPSLVLVISKGVGGGGSSQSRNIGMHALDDVLADDSLGVDVRPVHVLLRSGKQRVKSLLKDKLASCAMLYEEH